MLKERDSRSELTPTEEKFFERYKVSFDHDGVIAFSKGPAVEEYNRCYGTNHTASEIREFRTIKKWAMKDLGVSEEEAIKIDNHLWYESPDLLLKAKPLPGAVELTKWLADRKIFFPIITSRIPLYRESTFQWYEETLPWIKRDQIYIRREDQEGIMIGEVFKAWTIGGLEIDYHFEDALHHAEMILNNTNAKVILLNGRSELDHRVEDGLIRIVTRDDRFPTIEDAQKFLFGT